MPVGWQHCGPTVPLIQLSVGVGRGFDPVMVGSGITVVGSGNDGIPGIVGNGIPATVLVTIGGRGSTGIVGDGFVPGMPIVGRGFGLDPGMLIVGSGSDPGMLIVGSGLEPNITCIMKRGQKERYGTY